MRMRFHSLVNFFAKYVSITSCVRVEEEGYGRTGGGNAFLRLEEDSTLMGSEVRETTLAPPADKQRKYMRTASRTQEKLSAAWDRS